MYTVHTTSLIFSYNRKPTPSPNHLKKFVGGHLKGTLNTSIKSHSFTIPIPLRIIHEHGLDSFWFSEPNISKPLLAHGFFLILLQFELLPTCMTCTCPNFNLVIKKSCTMVFEIVSCKKTFRESTPC
jgi:hypothetical protein